MVVESLEIITRLLHFAQNDVSRKYIVNAELKISESVKCLNFLKTKLNLRSNYGFY